MKKSIAFLTVLFFMMTASASLASQSAGDMKTTTATTHKHHKKSCCCCDTKSVSGDKNNECSKMDVKKDAAKKGSVAK